MPSPFQQKYRAPRRWRRARLKMPAAPKPRRHFSFRQFWRWFKKLSPLILLAGLAGVLYLTWSLKDLPSPTEILQRAVPQSTTIFDRTGKIALYNLHGDVKRQAVKLADIPLFVQQATLAAEDKDFYLHGAFSFKGFARALFMNLLRGRASQGGSTITMQYLKNAALGPQKNLSRKIRELYLAYQLEQTLSKQEILERYLNDIPYGSVAYGVEAASQTYFNKGVKDLSLAQAAVLTALPQAPSYYSPYGKNVATLMNRQKSVLQTMRGQNWITDEQLKTALAEKIEFASPKVSPLAPHFVLWIKQQLEDKYGVQVVEQEGLEVITSLDVDKQKAADDAVAKYNEKNTKNYNAGNSALVSLDAKTGEVLALVGSADFYNKNIDGQVNVILRPRQPGSSFKPIVYATAFEQGYSPETILVDAPTVFPSVVGDFKPANYTGKNYGPVSMRQALAGSLNIPAVMTLYLAGLDNVLQKAADLGYTTLSDRSRFGLSLTLGGGEVTPLEHAQAFTALADHGWAKKAVNILKVTKLDGAVLEEWKTPDSKQVFSDETVKKVNSILTDQAARTFIFGPLSAFNIPGHTVAIKTGTTNNFKDAWAIGFTPQIVTTVWSGNSSGKEMKKGADGSQISLPIFKEYMVKALAKYPNEGFGDYTHETVDKLMVGGAPGEVKTVTINSSNGKIATEITPPNLKQDRQYIYLHNILFYVKRGDPRGPVPTNPSDDPMYQPWEEGVQTWIKTGPPEYNPPTEFDN